MVFGFDLVDRCDLLVGSGFDINLYNLQDWNCRSGTSLD